MNPLPSSLWRTLEKAGWPRHCRKLLRPGKTHALHFAIDHGMPESVWKPLIDTGVGLREGIGEHHLLTPLLMAANKGEPAIALALIEAGVAPGSPGYENHALVLSSVWFNGFNAPEKKTDYVRLVVFLLESAEHSGFFGHPPDYMNPSHNQALEEVLLVIGQRKRAGFEQQQLEEQLPTRGKAMRQERL